MWITAAWGKCCEETGKCWRISVVGNCCKFIIGMLNAAVVAGCSYEQSTVDVQCVLIYCLSGTATELLLQLIVATLPVVAELLVRELADVSEEKLPLLIEKAHVVESVIDVVKLSGCLTVEWQQKLEDYQGRDNVIQSYIIYHVIYSCNMQLTKHNLE